MQILEFKYFSLNFFELRVRMYDFNFLDKLIKFKIKDIKIEFIINYLKY